MTGDRTLPAVLRSLVNRTPLRLALFLSIALIGCFAALDQAAGMNSFHDAQFLSAYERHARLSLLRFHELPLWDPYNCGGIYGLAAPQTRYASPFFLLSLLFEVDAAAALLAVLLPALGMEGMFRYARSWGAGPLSAALLAPLFPLSGWFPFGFHYGWVQFYSFCLVPWILYGLRGSLRGSRGAMLVLAVAVACTMGFGGTYTLPMALVLCLAELLDALTPAGRVLWTRGVRVYMTHARRRSRVALLALLWTVPLVIGVSAFRLWPMLESAEATLRVMGGTPTHTTESLRNLLLSPALPRDLEHGHYYVAPVIALAALALPFRRTTALWLFGALSFFLAYGHSSPSAPFVLLRKLPVYDTLRYPERYLVLSVLAGSVLASRGASSLLALARARLGRPGHAVALVCLLGAAGYGVALERSNASAFFRSVHLVPTPAPVDAPFRQSRGNRWLMSHFAAEGMGSLGCGEAYPVPMSKQLRGDLAREEYLVPLTGDPQPEYSARRLAWSPNRVRVAVDLQEPKRLAINQNYHPGWHSNVGRVESWQGLLTVRLPAGRHVVDLSFWPRSGIGGLLASLLALVSGCWFVARPPSSLLRRALAVLTGPLLVVTLLLTWKEAPLRRPEPLTDAGDPVILQSVPAEATPLAVSFGVPLRLEAARLSRVLPAGARELPIELYFRRQGRLSASLGLFVHAIGPRGLVARADHAVLSGMVYFAKMPLDAVVRDAFVLPLPEDAAGEWEVRVGLWNAYSDGTRRRVRDPGRARVEEDAVILEHFVVGERTP